MVFLPYHFGRCRKVAYGDASGRRRRWFQECIHHPSQVQGRLLEWLASRGREQVWTAPRRLHLGTWWSSAASFCSWSRISWAVSWSYSWCRQCTQLGAPVPRLWRWTEINEEGTVEVVCSYLRRNRVHGTNNSCDRWSAKFTSSWMGHIRA